MNLEDHQKVELSEFLGLWDRGSNSDVPSDHSRDCKNLLFRPGSMLSRDGLSQSITLGYASGRAKRIFLREIDGEANVHLILDESGRIYIDGSGTDLFSVSFMSDFSAINMFSKTFITPHDGTKGLAATNLKLYTTAGGVRDAAGLAPSAGSGMTVVTGAAGSPGLDIGTHKFAVVYETDTGHIVPPGPKVASVFTPTSYVAPGGQKADISIIPTGPSFIAKRHLLATKAGLEEYFFIPNGVINDNVATTLTVDFADADLIKSAEYLFDLLETIPAGIGVQKYRGRLLLWGFASPDGSLVRISRSGEPESFNSIDGFIIVERDDGRDLRSCVPLRDVLYLFKDLGTYITQDNTQEPANWDTTELDASVGTSLRGVSSFETPSKIANDRLFVADLSGLLLFDGIFRRPQLTWKVQDWWERINKAQFNKVQVIDDVQNQRVYVAVPLDAATMPSDILVGDYSDTLDFKKIKWCPWKYHKNPDTIIMSQSSSDDSPRLRIGSDDVNADFIFVEDPTKDSDDASILEAYWDTSFVRGSPGSITFFNAVRLRVTGGGSLLLSVTGQDQVVTVTPDSFTLSATPAKDFLRLFNLVSEQASLRVRVNSLNDDFIISRIDMFVKSMWPMRPGS